MSIVLLAKQPAGNIRFMCMERKEQKHPQTFACLGRKYLPFFNRFVFFWEAHHITCHCPKKANP
jgi:hypothetical protein